MAAIKAVSSRQGKISLCQRALPRLLITHNSLRITLRLSRSLRKQVLFDKIVDVAIEH
jgi:hypothetical protein